MSNEHQPIVSKEARFTRSNYDGNIGCDGCGWSICWIHAEDNPMRFCPGCGNPIKNT